MIITDCDKKYIYTFNASFDRDVGKERFYMLGTELKTFKENRKNIKIEEETVYLEFEGFDWNKKKKEAKEISDLLLLAGLEKEAGKMNSCSNTLTFLSDGKNRILYKGLHCQNRFCPICSARLAKQNAMHLNDILTTIFKKHTDIQGIFLTLTQKNVYGAYLEEEIDRIMDGFKKFQRRAKIKKIAVGWFRALEVTYNPITDQYHPHLHVILLVKDEYFHDPNLYLEGKDFSEIWKSCMDLSYHPSCKIETLRDKDGNPVYSKEDRQDALIRACCEVAKYCVKVSSFLTQKKKKENEKESLTEEEVAISKMKDFEKAEVIKTLYKALYRRRTLGMGGLIKEVAQELKIDPTSEEFEDEEIKKGEEKEEEEVKLWIEWVHWDHNQRKYALDDKQPFTEEVKKYIKKFFMKKRL